MERAQVPRQSPRLSPRAVSTGSCCLPRLSRVRDPPPNEARSAGGDLGGPAVSVSPAGASGGPAGAGGRCSANAANLRRSFPTAQLGLEPWKNLQTTLVFRCLAIKLHDGVCSGLRKFKSMAFLLLLLLFLSCHPEVEEDHVFKN